MKHILKILKKYSFYIILVFVLLFMQANCDLTLPEYTSNIVNIGIQQSGIESPVPEVIREEEYNKLLLFMNSESQEKVNNSYTLITKDNTEYLEKYPLLNEENLYVLNTENEDLRSIITLPMIMVYNTSQESFDPSSFGMQIPDGMSIYDILQAMDQESHNEFVNKLSENYSDETVSLLEQTAIVYLKDEYTKIGIDVEEMQIGYIATTGLKMLGLALASMVLTIASVFLTSRIAAFFSRDLRNKVVNKVMTYSNTEFESFSTASLITRSTNDIQQIQMLIVMLLRIVFFAPIMGIGALAKVSGNDMSWIIALAVVTIIGFVIILFGLAMPKFNKVQKLIDKVNLVSREILSGIPVIRAFGTEKHEEKRFDDANKDLTKVNLFVNRVMTVMMPSMMFIMNGVSVLIVWVGASKIDAGTIQVGTLMAFITYTMQIIMSFLMISMVSIMVPRAFVSLKRIGEVLDRDTSIKQIDKPLKFNDELKGVVEFKDVYFRYPDAEEDVLQNISFKAMPGTTTAFIGSTGSGKSTLINLIPRFFDVTGGKILIDGIDVRKANIEKLRDKIGYVPQKGMLFSGTIESNIAFGLDKMDKEKITKAAEISQSLEFIENKKDKFKSEISQGGTNVSGGQRQRLAIARAIATDPEIYIFDDSFSALDYKTDAKLRKELAKYTKNSTIFIVAQRISTVMQADQIIVLDKGHVVGIGTHKELLKSCEIYQEIAYSQLSKEELENE